MVLTQSGHTLNSFFFFVYVCFQTRSTHTSSFSSFLIANIPCTTILSIEVSAISFTSYCNLGLCVFNFSRVSSPHSSFPPVQERPPTSSIMLSSKKSDAGSSSSSSSSSAAGAAAGGERPPMSDTQTGTSTSAAGAMDVKKKERSSPSGESGGAPLPHQAGPGGADPDSAEVRRTSRRKRAKVNIL